MVPTVKFPGVQSTQPGVSQMCGDASVGGEEDRCGAGRRACPGGQLRGVMLFLKSQIVRTLGLQAKLCATLRL